MTTKHKLRLHQPSMLQNDTSEIRPYRDRVIKNLELTQLRKDLVRPIELAIYQQSKTDQIESDTLIRQYTSLARHIIANLKLNNDVNNQQFIDQLNREILRPDEAVKLNPQEMHKERWQDLVEKRLINLEKATKAPEATTNLFKCPRCHRDKCTFYESQDRCADEPMTTHITCCYCGCQWKR